MSEEGQDGLEEMVTRARDGERSALEALLVWATPRVERIIGSYTGYCGEAGDLVQETLVEVWRSIRKLRDTSRFAGWLTRIADGKAMDFLRRKYRDEFWKRTEDGVYLDSLPGPGVSDEFLSPLHEGFMENLKAGIDELPARYRLVLTLHLLRGLNVPKIAESTKENLNAVKARLRRGLGRLRKAWRRSS